MIKTFLLLATIVTFIACGNKKQKTEAPDALEDLRNFSKMKMTKEDTLMKEWLMGKEWKSENEGAPMTRLKIYSLDSCEYVYGKDTWGFKGGNFTTGPNAIAYWPFAKVDDSTFTLYVKPTQKTYTYRFVKVL